MRIRTFWGYLDAVVQERILESEHRINERIDRLAGILTKQNNRIIRAQENIMARTDDLSSELVELGTAVDDLGARIAALPTSVDEITQEQLDSLRSSITKVTGLAVAAPEVPTAPVDGTEF